MISKRGPSKEGKGSIEYLVRYVVSAQGGRNPATWARNSEGDLIHGGDGERVGQIRVTNCGAEDPGDAVMEMLATQARNKTSGKEKEYHLIVSFAPGEEPTAEVLAEIEDALVASIGYSEHQRVSAVHHDTGCMHLHIAINKVHPVTFNNVSCYRDYWKRSIACDELEVRFGLQVTNHSRSEEGTHRWHSGQDAEAMGRVERLSGYVSREVVSELMEAASWAEAHQLMASHGLEIKRRGPGLVIGDPEQGVWVKASSCGRGISLAGLEKRFGAFQEPDGGSEMPDKRAGYSERAMTGKDVSALERLVADQLYGRYRREREGRLADRRQALGRLRGEGDAYRAKVKAWGDFQFQMLKVGKKGPATGMVASLIRWQARSAVLNHGKSLRARRDAIVRNTQVMSYADWLLDKARAGDAEALMVLRAREGRQAGVVAGESALVARGSGLGGITVLGGEHLLRRVRKDGSVLYRTGSGGQIRDRGGKVQLKEGSSDETKVALDLAVQRWAGQVIEVRGSDDFRKNLAVLAGQTQVGIVFADPEMEALRHAAREEGLARQDKKQAVDGSGNAIEAWVKQRNAVRSDKAADMLPHRVWRGQDAGGAIYRGLRRMEDGTAIVLLERKGAMLVKPVGDEMAKNIEGGHLRWFGKVGMKVQVSSDGTVSAGKPEREQASPSDARADIQQEPVIDPRNEDQIETDWQAMSQAERDTLTFASDAGDDEALARIPAHFHAELHERRAVQKTRAAQGHDDEGMEI